MYLVLIKTAKRRISFPAKEARTYAEAVTIALRVIDERCTPSEKNHFTLSVIKS